MLGCFLNGTRGPSAAGSLASHPVTGLFFYNSKTGLRYVERYLQKAFCKAVKAAGIKRRVVPYDLRGTFATHRAMVVKNFRQLQTEMGQLDPKSIQNYLDEAQRFEPKESIFWGVTTEPRPFIFEASQAPKPL